MNEIDWNSSNGAPQWFNKAAFNLERDFEDCVMTLSEYNHEMHLLREELKQEEQDALLADKANYN